MKSYQKIQLIGNLGQDPKASDNPSAPVKISLAITEKRGRDAEETTEWFDVNVWGGSRDYVKTYLSKGSKVFVEGTLESRVYQEKKYWSVNARVIMGLDKPGNRGSQGGQGVQGGWGGQGAQGSWGNQGGQGGQGGWGNQGGQGGQGGWGGQGGQGGWGGQNGQAKAGEGSAPPPQHKTTHVAQSQTEGGSNDPIPF